MITASVEEMFRDFTQDRWGVSEEHIAFLARFQQENGRVPRVLNIGNIANNAFKNAKILRQLGVECDVLCYDYYHVMSCPEWEMASFATQGIEFDAPTWGAIDLGDYQRPYWFAQGRFLTCIDYLLALRTGKPETEELWRCLARERDSGGKAFPESSRPCEYDSALVHTQSLRLAALFETVFPDRANKPSPAAIADSFGGHITETARIQRLFANYDLVVGYATDGFFPLLARKTPYACFEHGTIRTFPFENTLFGQMCALSYACASDVLISNCDNIIAARRLGLRSFRFLPHAMLEDFRVDPSALAFRKELMAQHSADFVIFHPARQHWSTAEDLNWEKGNDRLIRAFARFVKTERPKALLIMVAWGQMVAASKALVAQLDIGHRVVWLDPQPMPVVGRYVAASDLLADQFVIGAWGAIMPHGMMLGIPTMLYLNEEVHRWCFQKMPPVLNVRIEDDIYAGLRQAADPAYKAQIMQDAVAWYEDFHSETVVAARLLDSLVHSLQPDATTLLFRKQRDIEAELVQARLTSAHTAYSKKNSTLLLKQRILGLRSAYPVAGGIIFYSFFFPFRFISCIRRLVLKAFAISKRVVHRND
ncbi:MAG: hypothetical protein RIS00_1510 [Pseudomonadota bacterium]|jgi:glycosyltransferase involved in cell wall biosynthesis